MPQLRLGRVRERIHSCVGQVSVIGCFADVLRQPQMTPTFAALERIQPLADVLRHFGAVKSVSEVGVDPEVPKQFELVIFERARVKVSRRSAQQPLHGLGLGVQDVPPLVLWHVR